MRTCRIDGRLARVSGPVPGAGPFPDGDEQVVEAVPTRLEASDGSSAGEAVVVRISDREDALPGVRNRLSVGIERARPIILAVTPATRSELPLRRRRQAAATPACESLRVVVRHMHYRVVVLAGDRTAGAG